MKNLDQIIRLGASGEVADLVWCVGEWVALLEGDGTPSEVVEAESRIHRAYNRMTSAHKGNEEALREYQRDDREYGIAKNRRADGLGGVR